VVLAASFLPRTGAQIGAFLLLAAILIGAGRLLVVLARRRNHAV
jgi:LPXTG-motif cell wall-anchored protein